MTEPAAVPALLLVEDDPLSREFLAEALRALPAMVDAADSIAAASAAVRARRHALWLVDAHLPDGDGGQCLAALRRIAGNAVPALAISAGLRREEFDRLEAAGYVEVLSKPLALAALHAAVRRALDGTRPAPALASGGKLPLWDEAQALAALGGRRDAWQKMQALFLAELPATCRDVVAASQAGETDRVGALLHRLQSGCGFVGAARLLAETRALSAAPLDPATLRRFQDGVQDLLDSAALPPAG